MLKHFKPVSLILVAGAITLPTSVYADLVPEKLETAITQQSGKVSGVVEDDFGPVAGASVVIKGTTHGSITDMDGKFNLEGVKTETLSRFLYRICYSGSHLHRPVFIKH